VTPSCAASQAMASSSSECPRSRDGGERIDAIVVLVGDDVGEERHRAEARASGNPHRLYFPVSIPDASGK
jgi:hypothetical protein